MFDAYSFAQTWRSDNKNRKSLDYHSDINTFDVSQKLGIMATGGAEGKILLIDPYAFGMMNATMAHKNKEILEVHIYEQ